GENNRYRFLLPFSFLLLGSRSRSVEFAPQILDHPSNLVVRKDQPATLNCRADGNPAPTIEWYRNGKYVKPSKEDATSQPTLLPDGSLFFLRLSQEKGKSDEGVYHCLARNRLGKAMSKNASLYLEGKALKNPGVFATVVTFRKKPCSPQHFVPSLFL
uniref:Ig-like domain-containing protein n=1 Tax=Pseudonaja textilis TaxID=8673 RepID=A0A670Z288_PSETE